MLAFAFSTVTQSSLSQSPRSAIEARRHHVLWLWPRAFRQVRNRWMFFLAIAVPALIVKGLVGSLQAAELRPGVVLNDPVLALLPVADLSIPIFVIEYGCALAAVYLLLSHPVRFATALFGYGLGVALRWLALVIAPLDPPPDLVTMVDPVTTLVGGGGPEFTKDLFFSGHTMAMSVFAITTPNRRARWIFGFFTAAIGVMLMIQRVHYAIDVFVAPPMAYIAWQAARVIRSRMARLMPARRS